MKHLLLLVSILLSNIVFGQPPVTTEDPVYLDYAKRYQHLKYNYSYKYIANFRNEVGITGYIGPKGLDWFYDVHTIDSLGVLVSTSKFNKMREKLYYLNFSFKKNFGIVDYRVTLAEGVLVLDYEKEISFIDKKKDTGYILALLTKVPMYNGQYHGEYTVMNVRDSVPIYQTSFKHGNGYWQDYIYQYKDEVGSVILREEGEIKNSFKVGKWKYYDESGLKTREVTYLLNDSIDVRVPHCLFNKKEPCFGQEMLDIFEYNARGRRRMEGIEESVIRDLKLSESRLQEIEVDRAERKKEVDREELFKNSFYEEFNRPPLIK